MFPSLHDFGQNRKHNSAKGVRTVLLFEALSSFLNSRCIEGYTGRQGRGTYVQARVAGL